MISRSTRAFGRRQFAVVLAAFTAFGAFAAHRSLQSADAHETKVDMALTCTIVGSLSVSHTVTHTPTAGAVAGEVFTISDQATLALAPNSPDVEVTSLQLTIPIPAGLSSGGEIHAMGGTFTKAGQSAGADAVTVTLNANPGTTSKTMSMPELMIPFAIPAGAAGQSIAFAGPSSLTLNVDFNGTAIGVTCNAAAANPPLVSTVVAGDTTGTTAGPTPTTDAPTPTTAPVTTAPATTAPAPTTPPTTTDEDGTDEDGTDEDGTDEDVAEAPTAISATPTYTG